jgi:hypothetical protein
MKERLKMSTAVSKDLEATTKQALATAAGTAQVGITPQPMPELNGLLLQLPGAPQVYLVLNGFRCWVPDPATFANLFVPGAAIFQDINIGVVSEGPALSSGAVLAQAAGAPAVYLVSNGFKCWIPSPAIFTRYQFNSAKVQVVAPILINSIPNGPDVQAPTT